MKDYTLLMLASLCGHAHLVEALIRRGAHLNLRESTGCTALILGAANGMSACVQKLLHDIHAGRMRAEELGAVEGGAAAAELGEEGPHAQPARQQLRVLCDEARGEGVVREGQQALSEPARVHQLRHEQRHARLGALWWQP